MNRDILLAVVMPVYNEEGCIGSVIDSWCEQLERTLSGRFILLVVNDGSSDGSPGVLQKKIAQNSRITVITKENRGHGPAIWCGYKQALSLSPQWIFQVDSDNQFYPEDFPIVWKRRNEADLLLGTRTQRHDAPIRLFITKILRLINFILFGKWLVDANTPFRLIRSSFLREALRVIPPHTFAPNVFLSVLSTQNGHTELSLSVRHKQRTTGFASLLNWKLLRASVLTALELLLLRLSLPTELQQENS
jgi:dolichol-phosphate mannosyltransferase